MSAYMVDGAHIDYLLNAAMDVGRMDHGSGFSWFDADPATYSDECWTVPGEALPAFERWERFSSEHRHMLDRSTAGRIGAVLLAENRRSVNHRYDEEELEEVYTFTRYAIAFDPIAVLQAIRGLDYQSCEHPEWGQSEARRFLEVLQGHCISYLIDHADREPNTWEVSPETLVALGARKVVSL